MPRSRSSSSAAVRNSPWSSARAWGQKKTAVGTDPDALALTSAQSRRAARHDRHLATIARTTYRRSPRATLRGAGRQCARRAQERASRRRALACARWAGWHGWSRGRSAAALGLDAATLAAWTRRWADPADRLAPAPLGARPLTCSPGQRRDVLDFLALHGAALGVAVLQDHFPALARRDLSCLLHLARTEVDHIAAGGFYRCVTWAGAGRVWALDHTEPPTPIEGDYRFVLTVRDLASGCTLAAVAVASPDADSTIDVLRALIAQHGAPLVLKADNGAAFIAHVMRAFLASHQIHLLLSPAYTPQYNGACEAGNGTVKLLTHQLAARHGRPETWTLNDLEAARLLANRRITDRDQTQTPEQRFAGRLAITADERARLAIAVAGELQRRAADCAIAQSHGVRKMPDDALARQAIAAALSGLGVITIRSRRVRLSYPRWKVG